MQSVAQAWLIYRLTGSGLLLGLVGALTLLPNLLFGIYGGWLADRFARRRLLMIAQTLAMLQALILGTLTVSGLIQPWHILLLAFALGLVQAVETPVRQSFIAQLVPREDMTNAIALNSSMFHLARFVGPALAGLLVAWIGEGPVFLINALTFIAVLISLLFLNLPTVARQLSDGRGLSGLWYGFHYARDHALTRVLLLLVASVSLLGGATAVLMPIFVAEVYQSGPQTLGIFIGMLGAGSLLGALLLAGQRNFVLLERRVALAAMSMATALIVFALNQFYLPALAVLFLIGLASTTVFASSNALIQLSVPDELRGRVMALFTVALHGMVSVDQLALGALADLIGAPLSVGGSGTLLLIFALLLGRRLFNMKD